MECVEEGVVQVVEGGFVVVKSAKPERDFVGRCGGNHDLKRTKAGLQKAERAYRCKF